LRQRTVVDGDDYIVITPTARTSRSVSSDATYYLVTLLTAVHYQHS